MSDGVREFAETGATDTLDKEAAHNIFLDKISAPPVEQGVGETSANVFVDSNHTKVSFINVLGWFSNPVLMLSLIAGVCNDKDSALT